MIIGGGPAGNAAASTAARLGADVTVVERDIIGGAAHLLDCVPSKAMIATGGALTMTQRFAGMGVEQHDVEVDVDTLSERISNITERLKTTTTDLLESQGVRIMRGMATFVDDRHVRVEGAGESEVLEADAVLVSTGSRPRIPDWAKPDGTRILTTRDCYPPKVFPKSIVVIGSGVTGVEFVHMFTSFGADVTLVVSRQQVLPGKDPEAAAALEDSFLARGVKLLKGARAQSIDVVGDEVVVR